jgi:CRISPR-associated endonuclease Cas1
LTKDDAVNQEATASRLYYSFLRKVLPDYMGFERRQRRPPKGFYNAAISYMYAILYSKVMREVELMHLNTAQSIIHRTRKPINLVLDFMEPLRQPYCDGPLLAEIFKKRFSRASGDRLDKKSKGDIVSIFYDHLNSRSKRGEGYDSLLRKQIKAMAEGKVLERIT